MVYGSYSQEEFENRPQTAAQVESAETGAGVCHRQAHPVLFWKENEATRIADRVTRYVKFFYFYKMRVRIHYNNPKMDFGNKTHNIKVKYRCRAEKPSVYAA